MKKLTLFAAVVAMVCSACSKNNGVAVESVTLNTEAVVLAEGETVTLTAVVSPEDAKAKLVWASEDTEVATVENGVVTAVALGETNVTVTAGAFSASCAVKVNTTTIEYAGETYKVVALADGNLWFAENLRYVPEGKTVSSNPADKNGVWYPATNAEKTADPKLVATKGLLYSADVAFGSEVTAENAASFEGCQGICPEGWHIPTNAELTGLVGHNSNGDMVNTNAPYYDADVKGASVPVLNEAGFNWTNVGVVNVNNTASNGTYLITTYGDVVGALSYVWGSTNYKVEKNADDTLKNVQYYSFMSTINASNNKVTVAYGNFKSGYSVRCVKNKPVEM